MEGGKGADEIAVQDHGYIVNLRLVWATSDPDTKKYGKIFPSPPKQDLLQSYSNLRSCDLSIQIDIEINRINSPEVNLFIYGQFVLIVQ